MIGSGIDYPEPPLAGSAVVLRPFRIEDFEAALAAGDHAETIWGSPMPAGDPGDVVAYFEACRHDGVLLHLVIADPDDDRYLGEVMIVFDERDVAEVGCLVAPAARQRGCGAEALELLARWAFDTLGLARVQVFVAATNAAGLALAHRAGFRREGVLRDHLELDGVRVDAVVLGRLPGD
jgi:RimJ/RimL family protein N-acetyltransferase